MNIKNLKLLADYLDSLPNNYPSFDMRKFYCQSDEPFGTKYLLPREVPSYPECGTAACALGHTPFVPGIEVDKNKYENWCKYGYAVFQIAEYSLAWKYMFSGVWASPGFKHQDNTIKGAVARIRYVLDNEELFYNLSYINTHYKNLEELVDDIQTGNFESSPKRRV